MAWSGTDPNAYQLGGEAYMRYASDKRKTEAEKDAEERRRKTALEDFMAKLQAEEPFKIAADERAFSKSKTLSDEASARQERHDLAMQERQEALAQLTNKLHNELNIQTEERKRQSEREGRERQAAGINTMVEGRPKLAQLLGLERQTQIPVPEAGYPGETGIKKVTGDEAPAIYGLVDDILKADAAQARARGQGVADLAPLAQTLEQQLASGQVTDPHERMALEQMLAAAKAGNTSALTAVTGAYKGERTGQYGRERAIIGADVALSVAAQANKTRLAITDALVNVRQRGIDATVGGQLLMNGRAQITNLENAISQFDTKNALILSFMDPNDPGAQKLLGIRQGLIRERDMLIQNVESMDTYLRTVIGQSPPAPSLAPGTSATSVAPGGQGRVPPELMAKIQSDGKPGNTVYTVDREGNVKAYLPEGGRASSVPAGETMLYVKPVGKGAVVQPASPFGKLWEGPITKGRQ